MSPTLRLAGLLLLAACATSAKPAPGPEAEALAPAAPASRWERTPPPPPLERPAPPAPRVTDLQLLNGLRVVVVEHHRRPVVHLQVVLPVGAIADSLEEAGRTWFAVQLASDYYERKPNGERIVIERSFRRQVGDLGGAPSFEVGADHSAIGISGHARDTATYLRMLEMALTTPRHGKASFLGRRNAMLDALEDLELSDSSSFGTLLHQASFGVGHPYARPTYGTGASLEQLSLDAVAAHQRRVFNPRGATLLVVGDVQAERLLVEINATLGRWRGEKVRVEPKPPPAPRHRAEVGFIPRAPASTLIVCAARPLGDLRASRAALDLFAHLVGTGTNGRLGALLRERDGLTYGASAAIVRRRWAQAFIACSRLRADRSEQGVGGFLEAFAALRAAPPGEAELARVKALRRAELDSAHDDAGSMAGLWLDALSRGERAPQLEREREETERVTAEELHQIAQRVLATDTLRWILSGERAPASRAVAAHRLGTLRTLALER